MESLLKARKEEHWPGNHPLLLARLPQGRPEGNGIDCLGVGTAYFGVSAHLRLFPGGADWWLLLASSSQA